MIIRRIRGATTNFTPPEDWDESRDGKCWNLPVRISVHGGMRYYESAWEPTPEEIAAINEGRSIILRIASTQPPVMLHVESIDDRAARDQESGTRLTKFSVERSLISDLLEVIAGLETGWNSITTPDCVVAACAYLVDNPVEGADDAE